MQVKSSQNSDKSLKYGKYASQREMDENMKRTQKCLVFLDYMAGKCEEMMGIVVGLNIVLVLLPYRLSDSKKCLGPLCFDYLCLRAAVLKKLH